VAETGTSLTGIDGVGPVLAGRFLARTRNPGRFPSRAAFACYADAATVEVASAGHGRHRLPRDGDRQLNLALHLVAVTQARMRNSAGRAYYDKKIGEGKTHNEAMRYTPKDATAAQLLEARANLQKMTAAIPLT
jgi:transposase